MQSTFWLSLGSLADVSNSSMLWVSANLSAMLEGTYESTRVELGVIAVNAGLCTTLADTPEHTHLYFVHQVTLVSDQDSRNWCRDPMAVTLLEYQEGNFKNHEHVHWKLVICFLLTHTSRCFYLCENFHRHNAYEWMNICLLSRDVQYTEQKIIRRNK